MPHRGQESTDGTDDGELAVPMAWLYAEYIADELLRSGDLMPTTSFEFRAGRDALALTVFLSDTDGELSGIRVITQLETWLSLTASTSRRAGREPVGQFAYVLGAGGDERGEGLDAVVEVGAGLLDQAVGAQQQHIAGIELHRPDRAVEPVELGGQAERQPARHVDAVAEAAGTPDEWVEVAGPDHLEDAGGQVRLGVQAGRGAVGVEFVQEDGGTGHHGGRRMPLGGVGAQHDAQLAHDGGGVGVVALDVADHGADTAPGSGIRSYQSPPMSRLRPLPTLAAR
ncbi:hypothetical protein SHIRM173S_09310 [Streptomyces hirsutus]